MRDGWCRPLRNLLLLSLHVALGRAVQSSHARAAFARRLRATNCAACAVPLDGTITLDDGSFYNTNLAAHNVFELPVEASIMDEVERIFYDGAPFAGVTSMKEPYDAIDTPVGSFFAQRVSWDSNIAWVSVDCAASFGAFDDLFHRLRIAERLAAVVPHASALQLYSAFFVVRTWCQSHNFHHDYKPPVGTDALTLITPLRDYAEADSFQLSYHSRDAARSEPSTVRRYAYRRGTAIAFGSGFEHSTEPGRGRHGTCASRFIPDRLCTSH